jgi:hypothetical protein
MVFDGMRQLASRKKSHDAALAAGYPCLTPSIDSCQSAYAENQGLFAPLPTAFTVSFTDSCPRRRRLAQAVPQSLSIVARPE